MNKPKLIVPKHVWDGAKAEKSKNELEKVPTPTGWRLVLFPLKLSNPSMFFLARCPLCRNHTPYCKYLLHEARGLNIYS